MAYVKDGFVSFSRLFVLTTGSSPRLVVIPASRWLDIQSVEDIFPGAHAQLVGNQDETTYCGA